MSQGFQKGVLRHSMYGECYPKLGRVSKTNGWPADRPEGTIEAQGTCAWVFEGISDMCTTFAEADGTPNIAQPGFSFTVSSAGGG